MPIYDAAINKLVTRIVYDGPGMAGKTTNVHRLSGVFSRAMRSDFLSPNQTAGRTTYFDWLSIDSGLVRGIPMRTQFVTVPGQRVLARRRLALVDRADAIVFVVDSNKARLDEAKQMYSVLLGHLTSTQRDVPIVIQANKQDAAFAATPEEIRKYLELPELAGIVAATAIDDLGVRETAVLAMRAAASRAQRLMTDGGPNALAGDSGSPEELLAELAHLDEHATSPAAILLAETHRTEARALGRPNVSLSEGAFPQSPSGSGLVWPAAQGRELLSQIPLDQVVELPVDDSLRLEFRAGAFRLETSRQLCFKTQDEARQELVRLARSKVQLGALIPKALVLSVQQEGRAKYRVWTSFVDLPRIGAPRQSEGSLSAQQATRLADGFTEVVVNAAHLAAHQGVVLSLDPAQYAFQDGQLRYLGTRVELGTTLPHFGVQTMEILHQLGDHAQAQSSLVSSLPRKLALRLTTEELHSVGLLDSLDAADDRGRSAIKLQLERALTACAHSSGRDAAPATAGSSAGHLG